MKAVTSVDPGEDSDFARAQQVRRESDGKTDLKNRGAALIALMWLQKRHNPEFTPMQTLRASIPTLKKAFGRVDPAWGEVNRLRRGKVDLPVTGVRTCSGRSTAVRTRMAGCGR